MQETKLLKNCNQEKVVREHSPDKRLLSQCLLSLGTTSEWHHRDYDHVSRSGPRPLFTAPLQIQRARKAEICVKNVKMELNLLRFCSLCMEINRPGPGDILAESSPPDWAMTSKTQLLNISSSEAESFHGFLIKYSRLDVEWGLAPGCLFSFGS